jgi:glycerophosphoryl diester phosphodiesterase
MHEIHTAQKPTCIYIYDTVVSKSALADINICTDIIENTSHKMPGFLYTESIDKAKFFANYYQINDNIDAFILSESIEVITTARKINPYVRAGLYIDMMINRYDIVKNANIVGASVLVFPVDAITKEDIDYFKMRLFSVWIDIRKTENKLIYALTKNASGIITSNPQQYIDIVQKFPENTLWQRPYIIGHRGIPSLMLENTIASFKKAIELGADIIEMDIRLTQDNELVVFHDHNLNRLLHIKKDVSLCTLEEMRYHANILKKPFYVPTLQDVFRELVHWQGVYFLEIKSKEPIVTELLSNIIETFNIEKNVVIISFIKEQLIRFQRHNPHLSIGFLNYNIIFNKPTDLYNTLSSVVPLRASFNPYYESLSFNLVKNYQMRGISVYPWTINTTHDLINLYFYGIHGITTDRTDFFKDFAKEVVKDLEDYHFVKQNNEVSKTDPVKTVNIALEVIKLFEFNLYGTLKYHLLHIENN